MDRLNWLNPRERVDQAVGGGDPTGFSMVPVVDNADGGGGPVEGTS